MKKLFRTAALGCALSAGTLFAQDSAASQTTTPEDRPIAFVLTILGVMAVTSGTVIGACKFLEYRDRVKMPKNDLKP